MTWRNSPKSVSFVVLLGVGLVSFQFCAARVCPAWGGTGHAAGDLSEKSPGRSIGQSPEEETDSSSKGANKNGKSTKRVLSRGSVPTNSSPLPRQTVVLPRNVTYGSDGVCYYTCAQQDRAQSDPGLGNKPSL